MKTCGTHVAGILIIYWTRTEHILHICWTLHRACFRSMFNMLNTYCRHIGDVLKIIVQYVKYILNTCCRYVETYSSICWMHTTIYYTHATHTLYMYCKSFKDATPKCIWMRLRSCNLDENTFFKLYSVHKTINLPNSLSYTKLAKKRYLNVTSHLESSSHAIQFLLLSLEVGVGRADLAQLRLLWNHFKPICFRKTKHND